VESGQCLIAEWEGALYPPPTDAYDPVVSQVDPQSFPRILAVLAIFIAAMVFAAFFNWTHRVRPEQQAAVRGQLVEWNEFRGSRGDRTPRFTISGYRGDFRISPSIFRDVMNRQMPIGFVPGANVEITADTTQLASPVHPMLDPSASIIWVNGLSVEGRRQFDVTNVVEHEEQNSIWFIPLIGVPLALFGYYAMLWRRRRKHPAV
jgi:hypothetical protein